MTPERAALFLDSTIQIERVVGSRARQAELHHQLAGFKLITSTYVLGEYLRTLARDVTLLHTLTLEHEHLDDVMTAIARQHSQRVSKRALLLWANVYREGRFSRQDILEKLDDYITFQLVSRFMNSIDELLDTTACGLARERPQQLGELHYLRSQCTRRVEECDLSERLRSWRPELRLVADGLYEHSDRALARMGDLAAQLVDAPDLARGRNCTWYLGDLIIALEIPSDAALYTTNRRHFGPLCTLLGKHLHQPVIRSQ
ncbi:MAG: hypothetical protein H8D78_07100 [Chloroflexi bacterium]|nr:hypothetical protein [Chloroflexota bacterium]